MKQVVYAWLWQVAMFGGLFLRPSVFLNGGSDVHHQIGTKAHVCGFGGRVVRRVKYRGEAKVWFVIISFPESIDRHNFEVECQFGYPIWQKMLVLYWCLVSEVRIRWVSFLG